MPAADLLAEAKAALDAGDAQDAGELFSAVLQEEPENPDAWGGLIRALMALGQEDQAEEALARCRRRSPSMPRWPAPAARWRWPARAARAGASCAAVEARVAADPADFQARYELATALNALGPTRGRRPMHLLEIIRRNRAWNEDAARLQLLKFFEAWGFDDPATMAARRKLSALLFA